MIRLFTILLASACFGLVSCKTMTPAQGDCDSCCDSSKKTSACCAEGAPAKKKS